jgi:FKBP-type peptidyl-prolyl cis-trans isomerase
MRTIGPAPALLATLAIGLTALAACQREKEKPTEETAVAVADERQAHEKVPPSEDRSRNEIPPPPDVAAPPDDATTLEGGVAYRILEPGAEDGAVIGENDMVTAHYDSWTADGSTVDSTRRRGRPMSFELGKIPMRGFAAGVAGMRVGEKRRLWLPADQSMPQAQGAPAQPTVYDVEIVEVRSAPAVPDDVAAPPAKAKKTPKGVFYKVLTAGSGKERPREHDQVKVHYSGWTTDGNMFDSSVMRGDRPAEFGVNRVIPGWTDALQQMTVGAKWRVWIPEELAYKGQPGRPQGMLVFDVELLEVVKMPDPPAVPEDVAGPPAGAQKTARGVFYKVLKKGTGTERPSAASKVRVHYSGWTTDGKMFDSSVTRGQPMTFPLDSVIPGWTDGLQVMVVGDRTRFWIPEELAYQGKPNRPQGMLVFDVELLEIQQ